MSGQIPPPFPPPFPSSQAPATRSYEPQFFSGTPTEHVKYNLASKSFVSSNPIITQKPNFNHFCLVGQSDSPAKLQKDESFCHRDRSGSKDIFQMKCNADYNLPSLLANNIRSNAYFKHLTTMDPAQFDFQALQEEIKEKVNNLEPFLATTGSHANTPTTAFCVLYKMFTMNLSNKQIEAMLRSKASSIKALGVLFIRYVCPPERIWNYLEVALSEEAFDIVVSKRKQISLTWMDFIQNLFAELKYCGTLLPRIPKQIQENILLNIAKFGPNGNTKSCQLKVGDKILARYSADGRWYDAQIIRSFGNRKWLVQYTDYDQDNEEEISESSIRQQKDSEDELLLQKIKKDQGRLEKRPGVKHKEFAVPLFSEEISDILCEKPNETVVSSAETSSKISRPQGITTDFPDSEKKKSSNDRKKVLEYRYGDISTTKKTRFA